MNHIERRHLRQFRFGIAQHAAEGRVGFGHSVVRIQQGDADRPLLKYATEALLALLQRFPRPLEVRDVLMNRDPNFPVFRMMKNGHHYRAPEGRSVLARMQVSPPPHSRAPYFFRDLSRDLFRTAMMVRVDYFNLLSREFARPVAKHLFELGIGMNDDAIFHPDQ